VDVPDDTPRRAATGSRSGLLTDPRGTGAHHPGQRAGQARALLDRRSVDFGRVSIATLERDRGLAGLLTQTFLLKRRDGPFRVTGLSKVPGFLEVAREPAGRAPPTAST